MLRSPPPDPVLQGAHQLWQEYNLRGTPAQLESARPMKWGDRYALDNDVNVIGATQPGYTFIDIGPFPTPVTLRFDQDIERLPAGLAQPTWIYTMSIGLGDTAIVRDFDELPRTIVAQSLQVTVRRRQAIVNPSSQASPQFLMNLWVTPITGGMQPTPIGHQTVSLGIGTALGTIVPPRLATHVMAGVVNGESPQGLWLVVTFPTGFSAQAYALSAVGAAGPLLQNIVPIPPEGLSYQLRRNVTTAALDYTAIWLRH